MSETRLLNCILTEGSLLIFLGLSILLLPKITPISFGSVLCFSLITYGGYKTINAFLTRFFSRHYIISIISGILIFLAGLLLFFAPFFNPVWITSLISVSFILECITYFAFASGTKNILNQNYWLYIIGFIQFMFGITLIMMLPSGILWLAGLFAGFSFLISGITFLNIYFGTKR